MRAQPDWHALDHVTVESLLETNAFGLSWAEAKTRLGCYGPNQLQELPSPSNLMLFLRQFRSPLIYILLLATAVTLLLREYIDAGAIATVLVLDTVIGFTQERRAELSVRALLRLAAPHARVIRDGREWDIESRELVPGDLILLESGGRVPADIRLVSTTALMVDESLLTGESLPVLKQAGPLAAEVELADRTNMVYAGTIVARGRGWGYVVATGSKTELGTIAEEMRATERAETPLQHRMGRFAQVIGLVVTTSAILAFGIGILRGESPAHMFVVAVALAVSAVPEGLPVAFTITLALGVRRMARRNAIIRRLPAVETLGSTTVIGSDKTGTLTENRMTVEAIWADRKFFTVTGEDGREATGLLERDGAALLPEHQPLYLTLLAGVLTNEAEVYRTKDGFEGRGDPTETALLIVAARLGIEPEEVRASYPMYVELPFEPERQYSASIRSHDGRHVIFVKGAPERVLAMCSQMLGEEGPAPLDPEVVHRAARELGARGLRVLAMAYRPFPHAPEVGEDVPEPNGLTFLGLQGMMDPPRAGVREAIAGCRKAGIRVLMITGDHAETAWAIGRELGIVEDPPTLLTGTDLAAMNDAILRQRVQDVSIYARVAPEQKLRVVRALQSHGETVAVTGDGVNDAPALKAADIGIAMGQSGTDVAREAADMVLADDNFITIYAAVEEGRITFDNLRKVTFFLISTGAAEVLLIMTVLVLGWPLPFLPAQILWLNLVTNGLQDVALAFEPGEPDVLRQRPRSRREGIISRLLWERTVIAGLVMMTGTLVLFRWELDQGGSLARAQTVALTTMVVFQMFHVGNARSEVRSVFRLSPISNSFLFIATASAFIIHGAALHFPPAQFVLRVEPIELEAWARILLVASTIVIAMELHKLLRARRSPVMQRHRGSGLNHHTEGN